MSPRPEELPRAGKPDTVYGQQQVRASVGVPYVITMLEILKPLNNRSPYTSRPMARNPA